MRVIICDDEKNICAQIEQLLERFVRRTCFCGFINRIWSICIM